MPLDYDVRKGSLMVEQIVRGYSGAKFNSIDFYALGAALDLAGDIVSAAKRYFGHEDLEQANAYLWKAGNSLRNRNLEGIKINLERLGEKLRRLPDSVQILYGGSVL